MDVPDDSTELTLVRRACDGERQAFDELVRLHLAQATAVSVRLLGNRSDAAEVVQDAFFKAWRNLDSLQRPEAFAGWLMRIVTNLSLNKRRSRGLRKAAPIEDESGPITDAIKSQSAGGESLGGIGPEQVATGKELGIRLEEALAQLPEKQRLAIVLFTIEGQPQKQIAETLECSVEAVKWHVFQGRKKLKELLKDYL